MDKPQPTVEGVKAHIKHVSKAIKAYRQQAKELNAAANELAIGNCKMKRELKAAIKRGAT